MTVVAWDGKTLAADKRGIAGGLPFTVTKLFRAADRLIGFSGNADRMGQLRNWFESGMDPEKYPQIDKDAPAWCMAIRRNGTIERYEASPYPIIVEEKQHAMGNGRDYALAAMHLGCDAARAVEVACHFDANCGNGVDTLVFDSGDTP